MGGCVLVALAAALPARLSGLMMYMGAVAWVTPPSCCGARAIFSSAEASPSGYLVYKAEDASARYSLFREMAK